MKYKGQELTEFKSDKPVVFDPPKRMLCWSEASIAPVEKLVDAYIPSHDFPVRCQYSNWVYCAEIPEVRRATNLELAKWLAQGNGLLRRSDGNTVWSYKAYDLEDELDTECDLDWLVRKWDDAEWHKPTADYMGIENDKENQ